MIGCLIGAIIIIGFWGIIPGGGGIGVIAMGGCCGGGAGFGFGGSGFWGTGADFRVAPCVCFGRGATCFDILPSGEVIWPAPALRFVAGFGPIFSFSSSGNKPLTLWIWWICKDL